MIPRYSRKELVQIWSEENKYKIWLDVEIAEAQAMEKPILASDLGGSKETVINGKSGFLFKNGDPNSLAQNLNYIIEMDKDKLQSIGNEGRKNILIKFDVEKMCQSTFSEYKKLLKQKN